MEKPAIEQRAARYDSLFRGEDPYNPIPEDALVGLSGLCRLTRKSGGWSQALRSHLETISNFVQDTLIEHDLAAMEGEDAIFCFVDDEARAKVTATVSEVFRLWEITNDRHHLERLIAPGQNETKWLIVETGAAAMQVFHESPYNYQSSEDTISVARIIASWGPLFSRKWFNGQIIEEWGRENDFTDSEIEEWQHAFNPSLRKRFAVNYVADPLKGLERVKANIEAPLSTTNIALTLDWSEEEVEAIFNPALRKVLAVSNINNPALALRRIKETLETTLATANIAHRLGWMKKDVEAVFTPSVKKSLAIHADPISLLGKFVDNLTQKLDSANIAAELGWTAERVEDIFSARVKKHVALNYRDDPLSAAKKIAENFSGVLTSDNIMQRTGLSKADVEQIFTPWKRKRFAVYCIDDPLKGCVDWLQGQITLGIETDQARDSYLKSMEE